MLAKARVAKTLGDCLVDRCSKRGCTLSLAGLPQSHRTVIDGDCYINRFQPHHKLCDYIIFWKRSELSVVAVEMKSGRMRAGEVWEQLCGGAQVAEKTLKGELVGNFLPLLLGEKRGHTMERHALKQDKYRVPFRGKRYLILPKRCGAALAEMI